VFRVKSIRRPFVVVHTFPFQLHYNEYLLKLRCIYRLVFKNNNNKKRQKTTTSALKHTEIQKEELYISTYI